MTNSKGQWEVHIVSSVSLPFSYNCLCAMSRVEISFLHFSGEDTKMKKLTYMKSQDHLRCDRIRHKSVSARLHCVLSTAQGKKYL